jgi:hypothetical protein
MSVDTASHDADDRPVPAVGEPQAREPGVTP